MKVRQLHLVKLLFLRGSYIQKSSWDTFFVGTHYMWPVARGCTLRTKVRSRERERESKNLASLISSPVVMHVGEFHSVEK